MGCGARGGRQAAGGRRSLKLPVGNGELMVIEDSVLYHLDLVSIYNSTSTGWPVCLVSKYPSRNRVKIALSSQAAIVLGSERQAEIDIYCLNSLRYQ